MEDEGIFERFRAVLEKERTAIRRLDGAGVEQAASEKTSLAQTLSAMSPEERRQAAPQMRSLVEGLQRNGILLVHARGILGEILRIRGAQLFSNQPFQPMASPPTAASRLSIRG